MTFALMLGRVRSNPGGNSRSERRATACHTSRADSSSETAAVGLCRNAVRHRWPRRQTRSKWLVGWSTYRQEPMDRKRPAGGCGDSRADGRPRPGSRRPTPHEKTAVAVPATAGRGRRGGVRGGLLAGSRTRAHYPVWLATLRRKSASRAFELGTHVRESDDRPADNWIRRCRPPWSGGACFQAIGAYLKSLEVSCPLSAYHSALPESTADHLKGHCSCLKSARGSVPAARWAGSQDAAVTTTSTSMITAM
jgi:hypothetical protein